ncbi:retrovirus-related pol polyprotein from transposon TNT 1-94 [Tanacetum coccineum]
MGAFTEDEIADEFPEEHIKILKAELNDDEPWYADYVNYIAEKIVPPKWTPKKRRRFFSQVKNYFWDEPYAFRLCPDNVMRRCVAGNEILKILAHCHSRQTGGHHSASITRRKVYELGFFWPSIFKDAKDYVMRCDASQRLGNISSRSEMPQNNIQLQKNRFMKLNELMELRDGAYENTRIYKERTKNWHDSRLRGDKDFKVGDKKSIMELYMMNRQHGRMILKFVENGPLIWPTIEENGVIRPRKYSDLSPTDAIQADYDVKATNIILQGLPPEIYALVSNHRIAKDLWERIQLLMQGTSLTKQERGYVKLVRDLHTTNIDQLHAYLGQHEFHANEVRLMHERNSDPLALVSPQYGPTYQSQQYSTNRSSTPLSITYPSNDYQSSVHHNVYSPPPPIPQLEYAHAVNQQPQQAEFPQLDSSLTIPVFKQGDNPIDAINHMMSFLSVVVTSRYPTTNNQLRNSSNPRQQATINDGIVLHIFKGDGGATAAWESLILANMTRGGSIRTSSSAPQTTLPGSK